MVHVKKWRLYNSGLINHEDITVKESTQIPETKNHKLGGAQLLGSHKVEMQSFAFYLKKEKQYHVSRIAKIK